MISRIYRSIMHHDYESLHTSTSSCSKDQGFRSSLGIASSSSDFHSKALHSWIYPQSTLPPSLVSVLISSAAAKGISNWRRYFYGFGHGSCNWKNLYLCAVELDFLKKREVGWEESFRSLYYMLRKRACHIFYGKFHFLNLFDMLWFLLA